MAKNVRSRLDMVVENRIAEASERIVREFHPEKIICDQSIQRSPRRRLI
jgi:hypothetical protein